MTDGRIKVGVVGGAGYVGGELIRLLLFHPDVDLVYVSSKSQAGKLVSEVHSDLVGITNLSFSSEYATDLDVLFIAMGHGKSGAYIEKNHIPSSCKVIDMSRDFRLSKDAGDFVYGLSELNKNEIRTTSHLANPGCFATCIQLALLPFAHTQNLGAEVHITAITGSTGAGQKPLPTTHFSWRNNNISIYKPFTHQHLDEINQSIHQLDQNYTGKLLFIPMRGDFTRGIFASLYFQSALSAEDARAIVQQYYADSPFVHLSPNPLSVKQVVNTNNGLLYVSKFDDMIRIESTIDNLLKGAAGQAVQNMNLMAGLPEDRGLLLKATAF